VARELPDARTLEEHTTSRARAVASRPRRAVEQVEQVLRRGSYDELMPPAEYAWNEEK
jgi:hypothetical protein